MVQNKPERFWLAIVVYTFVLVFAAARLFFIWNTEDHNFSYGFIVLLIVSGVVVASNLWSSELGQLVGMCCIAVCAVVTLVGLLMLAVGLGIMNSELVMIGAFVFIPGIALCAINVLLFTPVD